MNLVPQGDKLVQTKREMARLEKNRKKLKGNRILLYPSGPSPKIADGSTSAVMDGSM
jgi:hypothetical protein